MHLGEHNPNYKKMDSVHSVYSHKRDPGGVFAKCLFAKGHAGPSVQKVCTMRPRPQPQGEGVSDGTITGAVCLKSATLLSYMSFFGK